MPHSQDAFESGCSFIVSDIPIPKTYLICETDRVRPMSPPEQLIQSNPGMKGEEDLDRPLFVPRHCAGDGQNYRRGEMRRERDGDNILA